MKSEAVDIRIKTLQFNLEKLNEAYSVYKRDAFIDVGVDIRISYSDNEETRALLKKPQQLIKERQDFLFHTIFNFTQTYYSIKEYLKKEFPSKTKDIENFFSDESFRLKKRKDLSNDLKHNPNKDLQFEFGQTDVKLIRNDSDFTLKTNYEEAWFYDGNESVEYCNSLYKDLMIFLEDKIGYSI